MNTIFALKFSGWLPTLSLLFQRVAALKYPKYKNCPQSNPILGTIILLIGIGFSSVALTQNSVKLQIAGINGELLTTIDNQWQARLATLPDSPTHDQIEQLCQDTILESTKSLKFHGYFNSRLTTRLQANRAKWIIDLQIKPGPPMIIGDIQLKLAGPGADEKRIKSHLNKFPLRLGDHFRVDRYNDAKQFLFDLVDHYGYPRAELVAKELKIDLDHNQATILLHLDTGPRCYFGVTNFNAPHFSPEFLTRFLPYRPGDAYSNRKIHKLRNALNDSAFFQKVTVTPQLDQTDHQIPVEITLIPKKARQYNLGAGFGTDTGIRGSLEVQFAQITSHAHRFKTVLQGSESQKNLELHYLIPGHYPPTDFYDLTIGAENLDLTRGKSNSGQLRLGYTTLWRGWQQSASVNFQHERYQLNGHPFETANLLILGINWVYSHKDHLIKPNRGYYLNLKIQGAHNQLLSSSSFCQVAANAKYLQTWKKNTQILLKTMLGYTAIHQIDDLPLSLQFYTGGTQSIRGYSYNSLGPGTNLTVGSITVRQRVYQDWYLAGFWDWGKASNDLFNKPFQSVGIGIVWRTTIGALELSYAKALTLPGTPGMIQFSMGPEL